MDLTQLQRAGLRTSLATLDLDAYRRDLWPRATLALREGALQPAPAAVVWPRDAEQVAAAVDWACAQGVAIVPYGAGSGVCGAAAGHEGSLVIDCKRMDQLSAVDADARTVRAGPGLLGQHMEDRLAEHGWQVGHSPSSIWCSTVGGYVAARSAGQLSNRYGVFDDMLLAADAITPAGRLRTGQWTLDGQEDLLPILCGSEGALGVITDTLIRVTPLPERRDYRGFAFDDLTAAWDAMRAVMQAGLWPSVVRLYDPVDTRIGGKLAHKKKKDSGHEKAEAEGALHRLRDALTHAPGLRRHLLDLPLALPGLINRVARGLGGRVLLLIGFEGPEDVVSACWRAAEPLLMGGEPMGREPGDAWYAHRHDVSYKLAPVFQAGAFADTMEVAAPWSRLADLYEQVGAALARHSLVMAHFSHAYPEGCSIYFSFIGPGRLDTYDQLWSEALDAARAAGGTVTHHHGVGQLKARAAAREAGAAVRVWREIKGQHDPKNLMNPGRIFPEDVPEVAGPSRPTGGPLYTVSPKDRTAEVDPYAPIAEIEAALDRRGLALRHRPDRPFVDWLRALQRGVLDVWETPLFAVQARFDDGVSVRLGGPPRSAAGPDLRWSLLRRARAELVSVPVRERDAIAITPVSTADYREIRPAWRSNTQWGFVGPGAPQLAALAGAPTNPEPASLHPTRRSAPVSEDTP